VINALEVVMFSNKPYLIRAFYDWIVDNNCTPYVLINASFPRCKVPLEFVENNEITLNISPQAVRDLKISNDAVEFRASFSGVVHIIYAPIKAVLAIYANENQQGMFFNYEDEQSGEGEEWPTASKPVAKDVALDKKRTSHLRVVD
jgi:stringent starvation protein B